MQNLEIKKCEMIKLFESEGLEIDLSNVNFEQRDEATPFDHIELYDEIQSDNGFIVEIIYYYKAMKYLAEFDASLSESLEIADSLGYKAIDINSELLASLLASKIIEEKFWELEEKINLILKK